MIEFSVVFLFFAQGDIPPERRPARLALWLREFSKRVVVTRGRSVASSQSLVDREERVAPCRHRALSASLVQTPWRCLNGQRYHGAVHGAVATRFTAVPAVQREDGDAQCPSRGVCGFEAQVLYSSR